MRFSIASRHVPDPSGTAAGRILYATCTGLIAEGHEIEVCSWGPAPPEQDLPAWHVWRPMPEEPRLASRFRSLVHPRGEAGRIGWSPSPGAIAVADDPLSFAAVEGSDPSVVTFHYSTAVDARAVGRRSLRDVQDRRMERRAAGRATVVLAYSPRVARTVGGAFVPAAYPVPPDAVEPVEEPVAAIVADWRWPPNALSLEWLLKAWREVRARVKHARLLLAGWGLDDVGPSEGVEVVGAPGASVDVLARAAVMPFPCPDSSGPKVKVMEAMALGLPVVTTPAGVEGLVLAEEAGAVVAPRAGFASALSELLSDPERRATLGKRGRQALSVAHAPAPAARERVAVVSRALGLNPSKGHK